MSQQNLNSRQVISEFRYSIEVVDLKGWTKNPIQKDKIPERIYKQAKNVDTSCDEGWRCFGERK